jgi:hypothetical protein
MTSHSREQRLWPVRWHLILMIVVVRDLNGVLRHHINYGARQARSIVPVAANPQVKRSSLPTWRALCPEPWSTGRWR